MTSPWDTPRSAPLDGTKLYVWIDDDAGGFEWSTECTAGRCAHGVIAFRDTAGNYPAVIAWRLFIPADRPSAELIARARVEFEEDGNG